MKEPFQRNTYRGNWGQSMKRRLVNILSTLSLVLCIVSAAMWLRSASRWGTLYLRMGGSLGSLVSARSTLTITFHSGLPDAPNYHYQSLDVQSLGISPVFAARVGGASRTEWKYGEFAGAYGTVCVVLKSDGSVDWDSPALPILQSFASARFSSPFPFWSVTVPYWSVLALFSLPPLASVVARIARKTRARQSRGLCPKCGYDLRASKDRCPECGTPVVATESKA